MSTTTLYVLNLSGTTRIYRMNPTTGSVIGSWQTTWSNMNSGMDYGDNYLWIASYANSTMYRCQPDTGSIFGSWYINPPGQRDGVAPYCTGDGGAGMLGIFTSDKYKGYYHNMTTGSMLYSWDWPNGEWNIDIAYDWRNRLIWKPAWSQYVQGFTTAGSLVTSFRGPGNFQYGMAYNAEYLWICGSFTGSDVAIYRVHCPANVAVAPASLGKVKALLK